MPKGISTKVNAIAQLGLKLAYYNVTALYVCHNAIGNSLFLVNTGWNDKIVVLKKTILQLYFKTFIEKINSGNLII